MGVESIFIGLRRILDGRSLCSSGQDERLDKHEYVLK